MYVAGVVVSRETGGQEPRDKEANKQLQQRRLLCYYYFAITNEEQNVKTFINFPVHCALVAICSVCILGWVDGWMGGNGHECCVVL